MTNKQIKQSGFQEAQAIYVSPSGLSTAPGSRQQPTSLLGAQLLVRSRSFDMEADITVVIAPGVYHLDSTLEFDTRDSGQNGYWVRWQAAPDGDPIFTGAERVTGWMLEDKFKNLHSANVGSWRRTRNVLINGVNAQRAQREILRPSKELISNSGITLYSDLEPLKNLSQLELSRVEVRAINDWTDRYNAVVGIDKEQEIVLMAQPAWDNNCSGWDTISNPFHDRGFFLENALDFLESPGQWFLDQDKGKLYVIPPNNEDLEGLSVEIPRLQVLVSVSGTPTRQVQNLQFSGITFTGTTWLEPSESGGYVDQQTGGFLSVGESYPPQGYQEFEASRPHWQQVPASFQISAAKDVVVKNCNFRGLGAGGIGIGNDSTAHHSGVGLATQRISVISCNFKSTGANAITVGGISQQAHHPGTAEDGRSGPNFSQSEITPRTISEIRLAYNNISFCADVYTSCTGILMTYAHNSIIEHNDITDMPYGAINTGYGWGANDAGGSPEALRRGLYDYQPMFNTPTTAGNNIIHANYVARYGTKHGDVGGYYNLSASPKTVISRNVIINEEHRGIYPDEGSRFLTFNDNVLIHPHWFVPNYGGNITGDHLTSDLVGKGNWCTEGGTEIREDRRVRVEAELFDLEGVIPGRVSEIMEQAGTVVARPLSHFLGPNRQV